MLVASTSRRVAPGAADRPPQAARGSETASKSVASAGQATVELVALLPILVGVTLAAAQLLAAGAARELAGHAAQAGAVALLQGGDPEQAARDALPGWSRTGLDVRVRDREVRVRLRPPSPLHDLGELLAVTRRADAGPVSR